MLDPGSLFSGATTLLGGLFGKSATEKANEQNIKLQKEFAQNGIQWKVADALKAGVHPLAALGASTTSFSPSVVGDTSLPSAVAGAGQDVGRAINASRPTEQRLAAVNKSILDMQLQGMQLDNRGKEIQNAMLASKLATSSQVGPGVPALHGPSNTGIPGQNSSKFTQIDVGSHRSSPVPVSDMQVWEDRYGDDNPITSYIIGPGLMAGDAIKSGFQYMQPYIPTLPQAKKVIGPQGRGSGSRTGRW